MIQIQNYLKKPYILIMIIGLLISGLYLYLTTVSITNIQEFSANSSLTKQFSTTTTTEKNWHKYHYYRITANANISQNSNFNIIADDKLVEVRINDNAYSPKFDYPITRTSYRDLVLGDLFELPLNRGENTILVKILNLGGNYEFKIEQKMAFSTYVIALICLITPLTWLCVNLFIYSLPISTTVINTLKSAPLAYYLIFLAIALRVVYFHQRGYMTFQHDYHGHIEYIKFFAEQWFIPLPHKGWEFPQQPLYYILAGSLFNICQWFSATEKQFLWILGSFTVLITSLSLIYAYRLVKLLSPEPLVHNLTLAFLAFTPSLVYMSARISNDPLTASLSIIALFYLVASYQQQFKVYFYHALFACTAVFLTKISTVALELLFVILLILAYKKSPIEIKSRLYQFSAVGFIILSYALYNAYYPAAQSFHFVNSGIWGGQDLRPLGVDYFFSFNFSALYHQAQSVIGDSSLPEIARSFPTYQYATMFFGEFDYEWWRRFNQLMMPAQQLILALGLIIPFAWLSFMLFVKKSEIDWLLGGVFLVSFILVIKFIISYPSMSNTDFRYYTTGFFILAYFFARGVAQIAAIHPTIKKVIVSLCALLFGLELLFVGLIASV